MYRKPSSNRGRSLTDALTPVTNAALGTSGLCVRLTSDLQGMTANVPQP